MSSNDFLKYISVTAFGILFGYVGMSMIKKPTSQNYELASTSGFLPEKRLSKLGAEQVSKRYFDIKFEEIQIPSLATDATKIKAKLTARLDLPAGLKYRWSLDPNVQSQMMLSGEIPALSAGAHHFVEIDVTGFSKAARSFVSLVISGEINSHPVGRNIITSSRPEESYEHVLHQQALHQKKEQQATFLSAKPNGQNGNLKKVNKFDPKNVIR